MGAARNTVFGGPLCVFFGVSILAGTCPLEQASSVPHYTGTVYQCVKLLVPLLLKIIGGFLKDGLVKTPGTYQVLKLRNITTTTPTATTTTTLDYLGFQ